MTNLRKLIQKNFKQKLFFLLAIIIAYVYFQLGNLYKKNDKNYLFARDITLRVGEYLLIFPQYALDKIDQMKFSWRSFWLTYNNNKLLFNENESLKTQLINYEILEKENIELKSLLNYAETNLKKEHKLLKVIGYNTENYSKELFVETGGFIIPEGKLVFNEHGVVGRAISCGGKYAKILLMEDDRSLIPARTVSGKRFTVSGNGTKDLDVKYLDNAEALTIGEMVLSSGEGNLIDDSIPIGIVSSYKEGEYKVRSFVNFNNIKFVFIIDEK